ncbi:MAG: DNA-directed RNA polymerase subunit B'', partial [Halodesulfurarchaeum sp.]
MQTEDRRALSRSYFSKERLAEHHFRSFNAFLERGMQEVVTEKGSIETEIGDKEEEEPVWVELGDVRVVTPRVREADGSEELLYPQEARLRNITYSAPVFMEMSIKRGGEEEEIELLDSTETKVGRMPIMVGSKKCNIAGFTEQELIEIGEDPVDPGGYFIINGSERVLMTSEDLAPNKILAEYDEKYGDEIQVAKTFSQRRGYRALVLVERNREGLLDVSFPSISGSINFVTLVRALGLESDEEIVHRVSEDPEIVKFMLENLEEAEVQSQEEAIEALGRRVASGQGKNYQLKRANYVIDRYLLPHLHEEGVPEE